MSSKRARADPSDLVTVARDGDVARLSEVLAERDFLSAGRVGELDMAIVGAVRRGHVGAVDVLLSTRECVSGVPHPFMVLGVARRGPVELADRVFDLAQDIRAVHLQGHTPLHAAAETGNTEVIVSLLGRGAAVNAQRAWSLETPLHVAADQGHVTAVGVLLDGGADPNARDREGMTPLSLADMHGHAEVRQLLLDGGADPSTSGLHLRNSLHRAAATGTVVEVRGALNAGFDPNARDHWGDTALHLAACRDRLAILRALLDAGANVNVQNEAGETPLIVAAGDQGGSHRQAVRLLLAQHGDLNLTTSHRCSALHALVYMGDPELLRAAIGLGAELEQRDDNGETPFLTAARGLQSDCLKVLADAGADTTARDNNGHNAADLLVGEAIDVIATDHEIAAAARVLASVTADDFIPTDHSAA